jgi:2-keto-4-pentenoate hydratase/2-oxohepta-3-ene-1,7-dioic acid hydratase in catechol pathway
MKLLTFAGIEPNEPGRLGAWIDGDIVDLKAAHAHAGLPGNLPDTLKELVSGGPEALDLARRAAAAAPGRPGNGIRYARESVRLLPPIPDPGKFFCVGKNNKTHLEELKRNQLIGEFPKEPTGFIKLNSVLVGDNEAVARPRGIVKFDYEPELTFVLGRRAFGVKKEDALQHIFGITLLNDLTAREIQKQEVASGTRFWTAKNMPGFGPVGPFVMTLDEVADPHDLWVTCKVNGDLRMRVHTGDVIFRIGEIIEHFSRWMPLDEGDFFAMGAPSGVAVGQPNADALYLRPGDVCEIAFEGLPALTTRIVEPTENQA